MVTVTTLKGFNNEREYVRPGSKLEVTEQRAKDLEANGLISRDSTEAEKPATKARSTPKNKKAPEADNKAEPAPDAATEAPATTGTAGEA